MKVYLFEFEFDIFIMFAENEDKARIIAVEIMRLKTDDFDGFTRTYAPDSVANLVPQYKDDCPYVVKELCTMPIVFLDKSAGFRVSGSDDGAHVDDPIYENGLGKWVQSER